MSSSHRADAPKVEWCKHAEQDGSFAIVRCRYRAFGLSLSLAERYLELPQPLAPTLLAIEDPAKLEQVLGKAVDARSLDELGLRA